MGGAASHVAEKRGLGRAIGGHRVLETKGSRNKEVALGIADG